MTDPPPGRHHCIQSLKLVEFADGQDIISEGQPGSTCLWLLSGDANRSYLQGEGDRAADGVTASETRTTTSSTGSTAPPSRQGSIPRPAGPVPAMASIGDEALHCQPYASSVTASGKVRIS